MRRVLGILYREGEVLIGKRRGANKYIPRLTWTFPDEIVGENESPRVKVKEAFKKKTGLTVRIKKFLFTSVPPENYKITDYYYWVEYVSGSLKSGGDIAELKWVRPSELPKYFTTSIDYKVVEFLKSLEE